MTTTAPSWRRSTWRFAGTVFPGPDAVTLAPASTQPGVPVVGATNVASTHYARGSRDLVAAAWADQTAGVLHMRVLDGGPTTEPEAPIAPQSIDVAVGGNAAPVATAIRFTADGSALLVAAQAVTVDGGVTTRASGSLACASVASIPPCPVARRSTPPTAAPVSPADPSPLPAGASRRWSCAARAARC